MTTYITLPVSTNFSQVVLALDAQFEAVRSNERGNTEPGVKPDGLLWQTTDATTLTALTSTQPGGAWAEGLVRYDAGGAVWKPIHDTRYTALNDHGTVKLAANLNAGGNKIVALPAATASGDAMRFDEAVATDGSNAFTGDQSMGGNELTDLGAPTHPDSAVRLTDLNGNPLYPDWAWWNTNRDALGDGSTIVVEQNGDDTTYTNAGYVPRELTIRLWGDFRKQGGDAALLKPVQPQGLQFTVRRWNADAVGGDTGTEDMVLIASIDPADTTGVYDIVDVYVRWKYFNVGPDANLGFYLRFKARASAGGADHGYLNLRKIGDSTVNGTIQAQGRFGVGT